MGNKLIFRKKTIDMRNTGLEENTNVEQICYLQERYGRIVRTINWSLLCQDRKRAPIYNLV